MEFERANTDDLSDFERRICQLASSGNLPEIERQLIPGCFKVVRGKALVQALELAANNGHIECYRYFEFLVVESLSPDCLLSLVIECDRPELARIAIKRGAQLDRWYMGSRRSRPAKSCQAEMIELLLELGADLRAHSSDGESAMHVAASSGNADALRVFVDKDLGGVRSKMDDGRTPLHVVGEYARFASVVIRESVRILLANNSNIESRDVRSTTPLHYAAYLEEAIVTDELLNAGADVTRRQKREHPSSLCGDKSSCKERQSPFSGECDVNAKEKIHGYTPLVRAGEDVWIAEMLLRAGADSNLSEHHFGWVGRSGVRD